MKFRDLRADEIECRVAMVKPNGVSLLLYKNARCDMNILDETVGPENWQREHYDCKGNLFCRVGINTNYDNDKEDRWVWKADCGAESYTEKEKGEASDSFKRAGFCWGIGRELYTAPFIWVSSDACKIKDGKCYDRFSVKEIEIVDKKIVGLTIYNDTSRDVVYAMNSVDYRKQANLYIKSLAKALNKEDKEIFEEAKKKAKSSDYEALCAVLVKMMKEVEQ